MWPASLAYSSKHLVSIYIIDEIPTRAFVRRLTERKCIKIKRWSLLLLCLKSNCLCLIISAKLFWLYVSICFSPVGNLTHNATRFSLLNKHFFLMISCIFLWLSSFFYSIPTRAHLTFSGILKLKFGQECLVVFPFFL
jgi:hypothetical protein